VKPRHVARFLIPAAALAAITSACARKGEDGTIRLNGRLEATIVDLAPKVAGRVLEVKVREGDRVKEGDLLATLDLGETALAVDRDRRALESSEARYSDLRAGSRAAEIRAAEADLADKKAAEELARKELERQEFLLRRKVGTQHDTDVARTSLDRAVANVKIASDRLELLREGFRKFQTEQARFDVDRAKSVLAQSQTVAKEGDIRAPADGVVLHRIAEPGLLLGPGQPAITLGFADRLYVRTFIPEPELGRVKQGQPAEVAVDAFPGRRFPAHVTEISPQAEFTPKPVETRRERVNLVYAAKVDLDGGWSEPLVPGQPADVFVKAAEPAK
jgi:HlyD family secretion protein